MRSFPKVVVKWNLAKTFKTKNIPFTWQRFFFCVEGTLKWWLQNDTSHIQWRLCRALEIRWVFVLLVNWSPLPKNLAVKQYVTKILKMKREKKDFSVRNAWNLMSLRSVNMNRVIQLNNPPKWFPHLYIHSTSISETKKCRKKQDPEVEPNSPGDFLFKSCFVEMFASQKKKKHQFSRFDFWPWNFSSPLKTSQGELARLASVLVQSGPKNQL